MQLELGMPDDFQERRVQRGLARRDLHGGFIVWNMNLALLDC